MRRCHISVHFIFHTIHETNGYWIIHLYGLSFRHLFFLIEWFNAQNSGRFFFFFHNNNNNNNNCYPNCENRHSDSVPMRWTLFPIFKADRYLHAYTHIIMNAHSLLLTLMSIFFSLPFFFFSIKVSNTPHTMYIFHYIWCSVLLFTWLDLIIIIIFIIFIVILVICERNAVLPHFPHICIGSIHI